MFSFRPIIILYHFQFDLFCESENLIFVSNSLMFAGMAIGAIVIGWAADKYEPVVYSAHVFLQLFRDKGSPSNKYFLFKKTFYRLFYIRFYISFWRKKKYIQHFQFATSILWTTDVFNIVAFWKYITTVNDRLSATALIKVFRFLGAALIRLRRLF